MFKLALNAGHGLYTPGKRCLKSIDNNETREWVLNSRICSKIENLLKSYNGIQILRIDDPTGQRDIPLNERTNSANNWKADFWLSIHHNAGINGRNGGGIEIYTYFNVDSITLGWQKSLYNSMINYTGLRGNRSNPLRQADFHECRETYMPACLCECGFMDSPEDTPIILTEDYADKIARACVDVVVQKATLTPAVNKATGYLDFASSTAISGWTYNNTDDTPLEVHLYISQNGKDVKAYNSIYANLFRPDLAKLGIGNGYHGFNWYHNFYEDVGDGEFDFRCYAIWENNPQLENVIKVVINDNARIAEENRIKEEAEKEKEEDSNPVIEDENIEKDPVNDNLNNNVEDNTISPEPEQDNEPDKNEDSTDEKSEKEKFSLFKSLLKLLLKLIRIIFK